VSTPVVTVASGGLPVTWVSAVPYALPVTEAVNGRGIPVTKVAAGGLPVTYVTEGGAIVSPFTPTTWNPADKTLINLSNGNLTATSTGSGGVRSVLGQNAGKFYFEILMSTWGSAGTGAGLSTAAVPLTGGPIGAGKIGVALNGTVWINNSPIVNIGTPASGSVVGIAADLTAPLAWLRLGAAGPWNANSGSANNPATGIGGFNIAVLGGPLFPAFWASAIGEVGAANFGASAFAGAVPGSYTPGWGT